jgi:hypothetical protein
MTAREYPDEWKVKDALPIYFAKYHFADGGYKDKYFKLKIGSLLIPVPNTKGRVAAVKIHDVHHLLTEYPAIWKGEVEIGAWEIASGCGKHWAAWVLNYASFALGLLLFPRALFQAFMMGLQVKKNLYKDYAYDEQLLNKSIGELRKEMGVGTLAKPSLNDYMLFGLWCLPVLGGVLVMLFAIIVMVKILR